MKTIKFVAIVVLSAAVAFGIGVGVLMLTGNMNAFASVSIFGGILIALLLGAFDVPAKVESIKRFRRNYGQQAAVFIGSAAIFVGSMQECEDMCDNLLHWGQQAHVEEFNSETVFNVL